MSALTNTFTKNIEKMSEAPRENPTAAAEKTVTARELADLLRNNVESQKASDLLERLDDKVDIHLDSHAARARLLQNVAEKPAQKTVETPAAVTTEIAELTAEIEKMQPILSAEMSAVAELTRRLAAGEKNLTPDELLKSDFAKAFSGEMRAEIVNDWPAILQLAGTSATAASEFAAAKTPLERAQTEVGKFLQEHPVASTAITVAGTYAAYKLIGGLFQSIGSWFGNENKKDNSDGNGWKIAGALGVAGLGLYFGKDKLKELLPSWENLLPSWAQDLRKQIFGEEEEENPKDNKKPTANTDKKSDLSSVPGGMWDSAMESYAEIGKEELATLAKSFEKTDPAIAQLFQEWQTKKISVTSLDDAKWGIDWAERLLEAAKNGEVPLGIWDGAVMIWSAGKWVALGATGTFVNTFKDLLTGEFTEAAKAWMVGSAPFIGIGAMHGLAFKGLRGAAVGAGKGAILPITLAQWGYNFAVHDAERSLRMAKSSAGQIKNWGSLQKGKFATDGTAIEAAEKTYKEARLEHLYRKQALAHGNGKSTKSIESAINKAIRNTPHLAGNAQALEEIKHKAENYINKSTNAEKAILDSNFKARAGVNRGIRATPQVVKKTAEKIGEKVVQPATRALGSVATRILGRRLATAGAGLLVPGAGWAVTAASLGMLVFSDIPEAYAALTAHPEDAAQLKKFEQIATEKLGERLKTPATWKVVGPEATKIEAALRAQNLPPEKMQPAELAKLAPEVTLESVRLGQPGKELWHFASGALSIELLAA